MLPAEDTALLRRYGLEFRNDNQLLICTPCRVSIGKSFYDHLWSTHQLKVGPADQRSISTFIRPSPYLVRGQGGLEPVDFRPVLPGYKCEECNQHFALKKVAQRHSKMHEPHSELRQCLVQRMNNSKNCPYVGVIPRLPTPAPREGANIVMALRNNADRFETATSAMRALKNPRILGLERDRRLALFYVLNNFLSDENLSRFQGVVVADFLTVKEDEVELSAFSDDIRSRISAAIRSVSSADIQLRYVVSPSSRTFKSLETQESTLEYSLVMTKFLIFLVKLEQNTPQAVSIPEPIRRSIIEMNASQRVEDVWNLVLLILSTDPKLSKPYDLLSLFVVFYCIADLTSVPNAAKVERIVAKVNMIISDIF